MNILDNPDKRVSEFAEKLGLALHILASSRRHRYGAAELVSRVSPAIQNNQIRFFFDTEGSPVGLITWALVDQSVKDRLMQDPQSPLHPADWTEGNIPWVVDIAVTRPGVFHSMLSKALDAAAIEFDEITFPRLRKSSQALSCVTWRLR